MPFAATWTQLEIITLNEVSQSDNQADSLPSEPPGEPSHIYNAILLSHKKERNNAIFSNRDGPRDHHTE